MGWVWEWGCIDRAAGARFHAVAHAAEDCRRVLPGQGAKRMLGSGAAESAGKVAAIRYSRRVALPLPPILLRALLALAVLFTEAIAAERLPNLVVILSDDYGYGSAGCYGANPALVQTPNIDRLASEGRRFTDGNTTSSVCSPTRYSLLTGRYCWRTSLTSGVLSTYAPLHIEKERLNVASLLKKHGYATAAVGKWHLGYGTADDSPRWRTDYTAELSPGPLDIGFDYHFSVPSNHGDLTGVFVEDRWVYGLRAGKIPAGTKIAGPAPDDANFQATYTGEDMENGKGKTPLALDAPRRKNQRVMATLTQKATQWIERQPRDQPFFLYFTPVAVHNPITPDKDLAGKSAAGIYGDFIHELDRGVGAVLDTLDRLGVTKDTLVLFTSDNGGVFRPEREGPQTAAFQAGLRVNGALRGSKHDVWEGGFKVPFLARWPGRVPAGSVCREMVSLADILATAAAIVGEPLPPVTQAAEDSRSFLPALLGDPAKPIRDDLIVHSSDGVFAIRKGRWKWIEGVPVAETSAAARRRNAEQYRPQLYDTVADPAETKDVSAQHPEVARELQALLTRYRDGGYSRELPPEGVTKPKAKIAVLAPLAGTVLLSESLAQAPGQPWTMSSGKWSAQDGGWWGAAQGGGAKNAALRVPIDLGDGAIEFEINFKGADRTSLRVEWGRREGSFRIEMSRSAVGITKNPTSGEAGDAVEPLARKSAKLEAGQWYPVRITFRGTEATAQVNDLVVKATHAVLGERKTGLNFLVFGESAGFRNVKVTQ
jgi:arylsulfatase A-like enzyme